MKMNGVKYNVRSVCERLQRLCEVFVIQLNSDLNSD